MGGRGTQSNSSTRKGHGVIIRTRRERKRVIPHRKGTWVTKLGKSPDRVCRCAELGGDQKGRVSATVRIWEYLVEVDLHGKGTRRLRWQLKRGKNKTIQSLYSFLGDGRS